MFMVVLERLSEIILKTTSAVTQEEYFYMKNFSKLTQSL